MDWTEEWRGGLSTVKPSSAAPMEGRLGMEQIRRGEGSGLVWITMWGKGRRWGSSGSAGFGRGEAIAVYAGEECGRLR
jgi:hypothetical protein